MSRGGRKPSPLLIAAGGCVALALASLALPSGPTYDPYAWLIWGRDLAHLDLATTGTGTSWKPLPAVIDAVLTPLGGGAADGWLVIARAGAMFGVFMALRLAWRLSPRRQRWLAGVVAACGLAVTREWLKRNGVGDAEGLMTGLGLLAFDRHLDGRRGQAYGLMVAAGLIRVETWPFVIAYGAWLWWGRRASRVRVALGALVIPLLWFGGDWLGSGRLTTAADRALRPVPGSAGAGPHPAVSVLGEMYQMLPWPTWIGIGCALAAATVALARTRTGAAHPRAADPHTAHRRAVDPRAADPRQPIAIWVLALLAASWTAIVAVMAQRGYAGLPRFLFMACGCAAVVGGVGIAQAADLVTRLSIPRRAPRAAAAAGAVVFAAAFAYGALPNTQLLPGDLAAVDNVADMDASLAQTLHAAGGRSLLRCGFPETSWFGVTALAWDLGVVPGADPRTATPVEVRPRDGTWHVRDDGCPGRS